MPVFLFFKRIAIAPLPDQQFLSSVYDFDSRSYELNFPNRIDNLVNISQRLNLSANLPGVLLTTNSPTVVSGSTGLSEAISFDSSLSQYATANTQGIGESAEQMSVNNSNFPYTFVFHVKGLPVGINSVIYEANGGVGDQWQLRFDGYNLILTQHAIPPQNGGIGKTLNFGPAPLADGSWHDVVITTPGDTNPNIPISAYVDGSLLATINLAPYAVHTNGYAGNYMFASTGVLDEISWWRTSFTGSQAKTIHKLRVMGTPLREYLGFLDLPDITYLTDLYTLDDGYRAFDGAGGNEAIRSYGGNPFISGSVPIPITFQSPSPATLTFTPTDMGTTGMIFDGTNYIELDTSFTASASSVDICGHNAAWTFTLQVKDVSDPCFFYNSIYPFLNPSFNYLAFYYSGGHLQFFTTDSNANNVNMDFGAVTLNDGYWHDIVFTGILNTGSTRQVGCYVDGYFLGYQTAIHGTEAATFRQRYFQNASSFAIYTGKCAEISWWRTSFRPHHAAKYHELHTQGIPLRDYLRLNGFPSKEYVDTQFNCNANSVVGSSMANYGRAKYLPESATLIGSPSVITGGTGLQEAIRLNGSSQRIDLGLTNPGHTYDLTVCNRPGDWSLSFHIRNIHPTNESYIFQAISADGYSYLNLRYNGGSFFLDSSNGVQTYTGAIGTYAIGDGYWHSFTFANLDNNSFKVYVDGHRITGPLTSRDFLNFSSSAAVTAHFGYNQLTSTYYAMDFDEITWWNIYLTNGQAINLESLRSHYTLPLAPYIGLV